MNISRVFGDIHRSGKIAGDTCYPLGAGSTVPNCRTFSVSCRLRCPLSLRQLEGRGAKTLEVKPPVTCFTGNMTLVRNAVAFYLPRRGRIKEGEALAVYFAMNISRVFGDIHRSGKIAGDTCYPLGAGSTVPNCRTFSVSCRLRCPLSLRQLPRQGSQDAGGETAGDMFHVKHDVIEFQAQSLRPSY